MGLNYFYTVPTYVHKATSPLDRTKRLTKTGPKISKDIGGQSGFPPRGGCDGYWLIRQGPIPVLVDILTFPVLVDPIPELVELLFWC